MDRQLRGTAAFVTRVIVVVLAIVVVTSAATGWLYWLRGLTTGVAGAPRRQCAAA